MGACQKQNTHRHTRASTHIQPIICYCGSIPMKDQGSSCSGFWEPLERGSVTRVYVYARVRRHAHMCLCACMRFCH